jgi:hypothetical protein
MRRNYSQINFNSGVHQSYALRNKYAPTHTGEDLPVKRQKESPFSELGLFLLGCVLTYDSIKRVEHRMVA